MSTTPKVSVGLPVYNGSRFLAEAIESILTQTFGDFELIISDNCSTDATPRIAKDYAAKDPRIRYVRNERNVGAAGNFNQAFLLARGEYFKWAADDDLCAPDFLEQCVAVLDADPSAILAHPLTQLINPDGSAVEYDDSRGAYVDNNGMLWRWATYRPEVLADPDAATRFEHVLLKLRGCTEVFGLIRSSALRRTSLIGGYYGSDKVLLAELALLGRFEHVPAPLFLRRCHPGQSGYKTTREREEWISGVKQQGFVFPHKKLMSGYLHAVVSSPISHSERLRGLRAIWRYIARPARMSGLLAPGRSNAFGVETVHPAGALVASRSLGSESSGGVRS